MPVSEAPPPGLVAIEVGKSCLLVIPEHVYLAGLKLGKILRQRDAEAKRASAKRRGRTAAVSSRQNPDAE